MAIAFEDFRVEKFRAEIEKISDDELLKLGRELRKLVYPKVVSPAKCTFEIQLEECRVEWRRRHPKLTSD